ncbi:MAG: DUF4440 domain-containing protein [Desulfurivibrio sp.]|nr:MAG: DUF4440 domain-containing protein [Desulfurivibrio sp.]
MRPIHEAITGLEEQVGLSSPQQALIQFYRAFNSGDLRLMAQNWAHTDEISMDNPLGGIKRGWPEIEAAYRRIFNGPAQVYVEYYDYTIHQTAEIFYAVGRERGYFRPAGGEIPLAIRTSRIFRKIGARWQQVHHHGSIDNPQLLADYQAAVYGKQP